MTWLRPLGRWSAPFLGIVGLLAAWEISARWTGLDPRVFPSPSRIAETFLRLASPTPSGNAPLLLSHGTASLGRLAAAMAVAVLVGPLLGILMGVSRLAHGALSWLATGLLPIPPYAYIPILMLWLGHGSKTIVSAAALAAALPLIVTTTAGVRAIDRRQVWALRTFGATRADVLRRVVVPAASAGIVSGLRQSFGQGWRTLVGGEFIASPNSGLGYLVFNARDFLAVDVMFAGLAVISLLGFLTIYVLVGWLERATLVRWGLMQPAGAR